MSFIEDANVTVVSSALPAGAATSANQATENASLSSIDAKTVTPAAGRVPVSVDIAQPLTDTQLRTSAVPVSGPLTDAQLRATAVPVTGTTSVNQGTAGPAAERWRVQQQDGVSVQTTPVNLQPALSTDGGVVAMGVTPLPTPIYHPIPLIPDGSAVSVNITSQSSTIATTVSQGTPNAGGVLAWPVVNANQDPAFVAPGSSTAPTKGDVVLGKTADLVPQYQPIPLAAGGMSIPVTISGSVATTGPLTDAQLRASAVPVSMASSPLPSGAATEVTLATRLSESDFDTKTGSLTEAAPASDTASSGLNGRLQRIAQRLTSLITALGSPFQSGGSIANTVFGATQSGTWTVQPGNTPNTTAWKVDGSAVTQPVSAASLPLPLGAATATNQTTGNATLASIDGKTITPVGGRLPVSVDIAQPLTDTQLRASAVKAALPQIVDAGNSGTLVGLTTQRTVAASTTTGSRTVTSAGLFLASDLGSALEGTGIPANAIIVKFTSTSSVDFQAAPNYPLNPNPTATATGAATLTVRVGFAGAFGSTRAANIVRQLVVAGANVYSGLGGTFCFQYGEDGVTAVVSEVRGITDFATVKDFDLLNSGAFFRILIAPSRILQVAPTTEVIFFNATNRTQDDGDFARLANQEIEEANAAMGQQFAYLKGFDSNTGKSVNIRPGGLVSSNSSATPLAGAASFNAAGTYFSLDNIGGITVSVTTDQSGTLFVDNAVDSAGAQVLRTSSFTVTGGVAFFIGLTPLGRFMRIRYTNGATLQTAFLLHTNTKTTAISPTFQRSDTQLADASILMNVKSVLSGRSPSGAYPNTPTNREGNLITADFLTEVAKGNVANHVLVNRFGYNADVDTASETIWQNGTIYAFPGTAAIISGVSSSLNDAAAGTGARTVLIEGLNSSYVAISETVTMTGLVAVVTTGIFFRVHRISVVTAGATASNVGTLTFTILGVTVGIISPTFNLSSAGIYTIPAAFTGYLLDTTISQTNQVGASLATVLWATEGASLILKRRASYGGNSQGGVSSVPYVAPLLFLEKSDMRFDSIGGANNSEVHLSFDILLVGN